MIKLAKKKKRKKEGEGRNLTIPNKPVKRSKTGTNLLLRDAGKDGKTFFFLTKEIIIKGYDSDYL